ncbi:MBL fold metallo-hydrolase [Ensifer aridi]|uniref:MBL fold metallo-hydrolase n=1 Tax=Ensifer aridi TaxID=1708715 RepID=UPI000A0F653B|nr:MBL fold metallo-hydrolase [Ensifer aridi]
MSDKAIPDLSLTRREVVAFAVSAAAVGVFAPTALAADFRRVKHGKFDITVVSDGSLTLPAGVLLPDATPAERRPILSRLGGNAEGAPVSANIPLIRYGNDLILVDNGSGSNFQSTAGKLAANLSILGVDPADITKVVFTHAHPDHSGATTTRGGELRYPNAQYFVSRAEWDFWTDKNFEAKRPEALHGFARGAQRDLLAIRDRLELVKPGEEIVPGMLVLNTAGHTPGHTSIELAGDGNLLIAGDACTSEVIFFEHPAWHFGFDTDAETALKSRQMLLDRAASEKIRMLGYHWAYPGIGYAERRGSGYAFVKA